MRRFLVLLAGSLLPLPGPAHAQATADQLNRLSLEALTAPSAGGGRSGRVTAYRSSQRRSYSRSRYAYARHAGYVRHGGGRLRFRTQSSVHSGRHPYTVARRRIATAHQRYRR